MHDYKFLTDNGDFIVSMPDWYPEALVASTGEFVAAHFPIDEAAYWTERLCDMTLVNAQEKHSEQFYKNLGAFVCKYNLDADEIESTFGVTREDIKSWSVFHKAQGDCACCREASK